jgi:polysaccharide biosynthesis transport protein
MPKQMESGERRLDRYVSLLRREALPAVVVVVVVAGIALLGAVRRPSVYEARAQIVLGPRTPTPGGTGDPIAMPDSDADRFMATQIAILNGREVLDIVRAKVPAPWRVIGSAIPSTHVVEVLARDRNPRRAADRANAYASAYVEVRHNQAVQILTASGDELKRQVGEIDQRITALTTQLDAAPNGRLVAEESLRAALSDDRELAVRRIDQLQTLGGSRAGPPQVVAPAVPASAPVNSLGKTLGRALFVGIALGVALAFSLEYLRRPAPDPPWGEGAPDAGIESVARVDAAR